MTLEERNNNFWDNAEYDFVRTDFIYSQHYGNASKIKFGQYNGYYNGCSWIAIYNALVFMGDSSHPANIVYELEKSVVLSAKYGIDPISVRNYFRERGGYRAVYCVDNYDSNAQSGDAAILMYMHSDGAHYIALQWQGEYYHAYNVGFSDGNTINIVSIDNFLEKNNFGGIGIIVINKQ